MSRGSRRWFIALVSVLAVGGALLAPAAYAQESDGESGQPNGWILVDADTGVVLDGHNEHETLPTASTVKLMTALTALEQVPLDSTVTVSAEAASKPARRIDMHEGEVWPLDDALASMLIVSANDAAYAIAESIGGDLASFAELMNDTARLYGLQDSEFSDPAGLDDEVEAFGGGSRASAFDLALAAQNFLSVPELAKLPPERNYTFAGPDGRNHRLYPQNLLLDLYEGATGLKTGATELAGHTLVASATRDERTMIAVVLGSTDPYGFATDLLDSGFATAPDASGTGERLPSPRVLTADARRFLVALAPPGFAPYMEAAFAAPSSFETMAPVESAPAAAEPPAGTETPAGGGGGGLPWWQLALVGGALLVAALAVRRTLVVRDRRRRLRRRAALAEAKRRGTIHIIDKESHTDAGEVERVRKHPSLGTRSGGQPSLR